MEAIIERVKREAEIVAAAGFDAVLIENYGDIPFFANEVPSETIAAMAVCGDHARRTSGITLGINVLRNDGRGALSVAVACGAKFIRVNVLVGARITDQGIVQSDSAAILRARKNLGALDIAIVADVDVKHSSPVGTMTVDGEAIDAMERGMADALIVSGSRTGEEASRDSVLAVRHASKAPVWLGSGVKADTLSDWLAIAQGVIVGSDLRVDGKAGGPIDRDRAFAFTRARNG